MYKTQASERLIQLLNTTAYRLVTVRALRARESLLAEELTADDNLSLKRTRKYNEWVRVRILLHELGDQ